MCRISSSLFSLFEFFEFFEFVCSAHRLEDITIPWGHGRGRYTMSSFFDPSSPDSASAPRSSGQLQAWTTVFGVSSGECFAWFHHVPSQTRL